MAKLTANQKKALWALTITTLGGVVIAAIKVLPSFRAEPSSPTPAPIIAPSTPSKSQTSSGNNSPVINAEGGSTVTVGSPPDPRVGDLLKRGLPESDHPVVNLARPIEEQIQVFPEDKIEVVGWSDRVEAIWLGNQWETVTPNSQRIYTVWGPPGEPVTPKFRGQGEVKLSISFTKNRERPRDLRDSRPNKPDSKP
ncbi:MAG: hypothetical protein RLZZ179_2298 [Verrucomicrobiota bacterium]|jgi:hypothetical protein